MNFAAAQEHMPEAEGNNCVIKQHVQPTFHNLPYDHIPKKLMQIVLMEAAKKLNFFPAKHGVSKYYSPWNDSHEHNLDFSKHCKHALSEYVIGIHESEATNTK